MTKELFEKALKIQEEIELNKKTLIPLEARVKRFDDYIEWMDGRHQPIKVAGKTYKKAEINFYMDERPTNTHVEDLFDMVEENKKDFLIFLKKCQTNYQKKILEVSKQIKKLEEEFVSLGEHNVEEKTA